MQPDLFPKPPPLILELKGIAMKPSRKRKTEEKFPNCHIPSFKNMKRWTTSLPNGRPLKRPFLITEPRCQDWKERAVDSLESQLLSKCLITGEGIQQALSRLSAILSQLPADDSVSDLPCGSWSVQLVTAGEEGATITLERL
jgi:hypothetical protein